MWTRLARWIVVRLPMTILTNPFEIFLAGLCVLSGLPFLFQVAPQPGSLEALLPPWLVFAWGAQLVLGGGLVLIGVVFDTRRTERFGLTLLGPAALIYALAIGSSIGPSGIVAAAIVLAFGLACIIRLATITVEAAALRRMADEL